MNEKIQFNPLPLPSDRVQVTVTEEAKEPALHQERTRARNPGRTRKPKTIQVASTRKLTIAQIKARLQRRLAKLDTARLKRLLRTCGLGFAVIASVALLAKYAPIVLVLIGVLGLAGLASLHARMYRLCRPRL